MSDQIDPLSIPLPEDKTKPPESTAKRKFPDESRSQTKKKKRKRKKDAIDINDLSFQGPKEEQELMAKLMGFSSFDSTKGKMVPGNQVGSVHVVRKRRYRQYMNRKGGFNRPLDKVA